MRVFATTLALLLSASVAAAAPGPTTATSSTTTSTSISTTSTSSSSCTTTPIPNPPKLLYCNETGSLNLELVAEIDSKHEQSHPNPFVACRTSCLNDPSCISFGYDSSTRYCTRYSKTLRKQGFKKSAKSNTTYANRHCFNTICTTPPPTTTLPPVCTPTFTQVVINGGFEATSNSSETPDWSTQGNVTFPDNSQNAYSGNYYAALVADASGNATSITQSLTGLDTTKQYVLNYTINTISFNIDQYSGYCTITASLDNSTIATGTFSGDQTNGAYIFQFGTVQPSSDTADLIMSLQCYDQPGSPPVSDASEIYLDNIAFFDPDLSCAMYIQVTPSGSSVDDQYLYIDSDPEEDNSSIQFTNSTNSATQFSLDPYGQIFSIAPGYETGYWFEDGAVQEGPNRGEYIPAEPLSDIAFAFIDGRYTGFFLCSITPETFNLTCSSYGDSTLFNIDNYLSLGDSLTQGASPITLQISYVNYNGTA